MSFSLSVFHGLDEGDPTSFAVLASTGGELITVVVNSISPVVRGMMNLRNGMMIEQSRLATWDVIGLLWSCRGLNFVNSERHSILPCGVKQSIAPSNFEREAMPLVLPTATVNIWPDTAQGRSELYIHNLCQFPRLFHPFSVERVLWIVFFE
jgi:hypothetical protein